MKDVTMAHFHKRLNDIEQHLVNLIFPIQQISELFKDNQRVGHLMHLLSQPIVIDDRYLKLHIENLRVISKSIQSSAKDMDIVQTLSEIKYIGNRLENIESDIRQIKKEGIRKNVCVEVSMDGHPLEKSLEKKTSPQTIKRKRGRPSLRK